MGPEGSAGPVRPVRLYTLGGFRIEIEGAPLRLSSRGRHKPLEMLKLIVALGGEQAAVADISETLWPDADGDLAYKSFSITLNRLRKLIGRDSLLLQGGRLALNPELCWADALAFGTALTSAERSLGAGDLAAAHAQAEAALALYGGPFLPGEFDLAEVLAARERLHGAFLRLIGGLGSVHEHQGALERAIPLYQKGLEVDPLAEELYQRLMACYRQQGRLAEAIAVYQRCRQLLQASVDVDPSAATRALYESIVADQRGHNTAQEGHKAPAPLPQAATADAATAISPDIGPVAPVPADAERRHATVLFSDLVGYTGLNEAFDPETVDEIVSRIKAEAVRIVEAHGGLVNQFVGDEIVALFGVRSAHEDDPCRAVHAALALHEAVRELSATAEEQLGKPLRLHSAVNSGLMLVRAQDEREGLYALTGDVITTAARLRSLAPPDEVWVGPDTAALITAYFLTEPCEPVTVRGRQTPLVPARVVGAGPFRSRFDVAKQEGLTPFDGRETELEVLQGCLDKVLGGEGQLVTVVGEAGMGKSRLLYEFAHSLDRSRLILLRGRCQPHEVSTPYHPFVALLRRGLYLHEVESASITAERVRSQLLAVDPALERYLPCYLHLLAVPSPTHPLPSDLHGEALGAALVEALAALVTLGLRQRPMVILVEDWHWADDASKAGLKAMVDVIASYPLLLMLSYRPEYEAHWGNRAHHTQIALKPLGLGHTSRMVAARIGSPDLPADLLERIHRMTEGNPLFIEELGRSLLESGAVRVGQDQAGPKLDEERLIIPDTVQAVIRSRLDRLDPEAAEVLKLASVVGDEFPLHLLQHVSPPSLPLGAALERLKDVELIHQTQVYPEAIYRFSHTIARQVVYEGLLIQRRAALHEQIAHRIESLHADRLAEHYELLAFHFAHSADGQKALDYLERSGDKAARLFALNEARRYYRDAVERLHSAASTPAAVTERIDLSLKWGSVSFYSPSLALAEALEAANADARALKDAGRMARTTCWCGIMHYALGNHDQALVRLQACRDLPEVAGDPEVQALATCYLGRVGFYLADLPAACTHLEEGIKLLRGQDRHPEAANSLAILAIAYAFRGDFVHASRLTEQVVTHAERLNSPVAQTVAHISKAIVAALRGSWSEVTEPATRSHEISSRIGNAQMEGTALWVIGYADACSGKAEQGLRLMREGIERIEGTESRLGLGAYCGRMAVVCADAGHDEEAAALADKAIALVDSGADRLGEHMAHATRAELEARRPGARWEDVTAIMNRAIGLARDRGIRPDEAILELRHARLGHARGLSAEALKLARQARQAFRDNGMKEWAGKADRLIGEIQPGATVRRRTGSQRSASKP